MIEVRLASSWVQGVLTLNVIVFLCGCYHYSQCNLGVYHYSCLSAYYAVVG